ncbi:MULTISPECIES: hypothetical protein [Streptosporangium]|uniref:hypothetical protein n=1 Tax=Streptosporangium TaxID=2000 RepID=UPI00351F8C4B
MNCVELTISTTGAEAGMGGASSCSLKDLWSKAVISATGTVSASVPGHGTVMSRGDAQRSRPALHRAVPAR